MKYFFAVIRETCREMDFDSSFLMAVNENEKNPGDVADDIVARYRGGDEAVASLHTMTPITKDEYDVMAKYLAVLP